jgi:cell division protein FtsN
MTFSELLKIKLDFLIQKIKFKKGGEMMRKMWITGVFLLVLACAAKKEVEVPEEIDTLLVEEAPVKVETVYITQTIVETVEVVPEELIPKEEEITPVRKCNYKVQIGAFKVKENANNFHTLYQTEFDDVYIDYVAPYYKVRVGCYKSYKPAFKMRKKCKNKGIKDAWIVPINHFK